MIEVLTQCSVRIEFCSSVSDLKHLMFVSKGMHHACFITARIEEALQAELASTGPSLGEIASVLVSSLCNHAHCEQQVCD